MQSCNLPGEAAVESGVNGHFTAAIAGVVPVALVPVVGSSAMLLGHGEVACPISWRQTLAKADGTCS